MSMVMPCRVRRSALLAAILGCLLSSGNKLASAQDEDLVSLNSLPAEDIKDYERISALAQLIKADCPSMLPEELAFPAVPVLVKSTPGIKDLWLQAARRPESDLQLEAAEAIARAHAQGMPDLEDVAPVLVELLDAEDADHLVRLAAARALIVLDSRESAHTLQKHARGGLELAQLIEPVLAEWNEPTQRSEWLSRLKEKTARPALIALAIEAAAATNLVEATPSLRSLVFDRKAAPNLRLEAAKTLGIFAAKEIIADAQQIVSKADKRDQFFEHMLAVHLLAHQSSVDAVALLMKLAVDPQPATAAIAFGRLMELDPEFTRPVMDWSLSNSDPKLRVLAGEALYRLQTGEDIARLSMLLDDEHPAVRSSARQWMIQADENAELSESVRQAVSDVLNSEGPRGLAQAALVLGVLDEESAADRLVELLPHEAGDVSIAAAWALRRLAVPESAEGVYKHLHLETEDSKQERPKPSRGGPSLDWTWDMYEQHKHLIELLGLLEYRPADSLFRQFIPYPPNPPLGHPFVWIHCNYRRELRSRALWALGRIHASEPPTDLVAALSERLQDMGEVSHVSAMSALSLGRMKSAEAEQALQTFYHPGVLYTESNPPESVRAWACHTALEWLTGESLPPPTVKPYEIYKSTWFLEPLDVGEDTDGPE